jgi:hypothetical protein
MVEFAAHFLFECIGTLGQGHGIIHLVSSSAAGTVASLTDHEDFAEFAPLSVAGKLVQRHVVGHPPRPLPLYPVGSRRSGA